MTLIKRAAALALLTFALLPVVFFYAATVFAASEGPNNPDTAANVDRPVATSPWVSASNATASDNSYVTTSVGTTGAAASDYLQATDFDFAIPSGATIDGIIVEVEGKSSDGLGGDDDARLMAGSGIVGSDQGPGAGFPTSDTYATYGSSSNLWGTTWSDTDINATTFGFSLSVRKLSGFGGSNVSVDHIRITVHYTEAAAGAAPAFQVREISIF